MPLARLARECSQLRCLRLSDLRLPQECWGALLLPALLAARRAPSSLPRTLSRNVSRALPRNLSRIVSRNLLRNSAAAAPHPSKLTAAENPVEKSIESPFDQCVGNPSMNVSTAHPAEGCRGEIDAA